MRRRRNRLLQPLHLCIRLLLLSFISLSAIAQTTAPNQWTWIGGSNAGYEPPVTGTLGALAPGNIPAARYQSVSWTDKNGNLWLFGGDSSSSPNGDLVLNDLWEFNPTTNDWGWMAGSTTANAPGVYGTKGVASPQNTPGAREDASGWTDGNGNFWLFGGYGLDANGSWGILNDLWEFNPSTGEWSWMSGSSVIGGTCFFNGKACAQPAVYGTLGTPASGNTPGSREAAITWTDKAGNLWMFGGWSYDVPNQVQYYFNELWEYNTSTNQWAWMGGSNTREGSYCFININISWNYYTCGEPGVYGTEGTPAAGNIPGGRQSGTGWTDAQGNLWLFSGSGFDVNGNFGDPNDLWKFSPSSGQWTWMSGNSSVQPCDAPYCTGPEFYGPLGIPDARNIPLGRDHAVGWKDSGGNLWLFGGGGAAAPNNIGLVGSDELNDLWMLNPSTNLWTVMGGNYRTLCGNACVPDPGAVYGAFGVSAPGNNPGDRFASVGWTDSKGNFWLFGGTAVDTGYLFNNDLWEYQPSATDALPTTATPTFSVPTGSYNSAQSVTINDATNGAFIYYTTDGTTPTLNSTLFNPSFSQPISVQHSETLKAIAVADGCYTSAASTASYTLPPQAATPTFSVPSGTYASFQTVTISDATPGTTIYYTIDGSTPTTSSNRYNGPISITTSVTLQAVATGTGYSISNVGSAIYSLNLPTTAMPTFSVLDGTYNTPQTVTISDATPGATIYYAINGYPSTTSAIYTSPITVSTSETVRAMATATNYFASGVAGATYDINPNATQTAAPVFSVPAGTYSAAQTVSISDATSLAAIYFTTDGTTPTTSSSLYSGPIVVSSSETLKAIASSSGYTLSGITSAAYIINLPTPSFTITGTAISIAPGATTGNTSVITLTPAGGFTGAINLSCAITPTAASNPATCSISPTVVISGSAPQTTTLTVNTTAATSALNPAGSPFRPSVGSVAVGCILLAFMPFPRRKKWRIFGILVLSISIVSGAISCGGGSTGITGGGGQLGTTPGTYTITITGTAGTTTQTGTASLTVR